MTHIQELEYTLNMLYIAATRWMRIETITNKFNIFMLQEILYSSILAACKESMVSKKVIAKAILAISELLDNACKPQTGQ